MQHIFLGLLKISDELHYLPNDFQEKCNKCFTEHTVHYNQMIKFSIPKLRTQTHKKHHNEGETRTHLSSIICFNSLQYKWSAITLKLVICLNIKQRILVHYVLNFSFSKAQSKTYRIGSRVLHY